MKKILTKTDMTELHGESMINWWVVANSLVVFWPVVVFFLFEISSGWIFNV